LGELDLGDAFVLPRLPEVLSEPPLAQFWRCLGIGCRFPLLIVCHDDTLPPKSVNVY
jgi:hypothetical protein